MRLPESDLPTLLGGFKSYTTQLYWKRGREVIESQEVYLPSGLVEKTDPNESRPLLAALMEWRATLRPEIVELKNWPRLKPQQFLGKSLIRVNSCHLVDRIIASEENVVRL